MIFHNYFSLKKTPNHTNFLNKGSFLLEIAIGISIIGIISGFFMAKQIAVNRMVQIQKTRSNIEVAVASIVSYVANHGRIPRPADGNGIESENIGICIGTIPYNTLGISERNVVDGKGMPLKYIVEPKLTTCCGIHKNTLEMKDVMDTRSNCFCDAIPLKDQKIIIKNQSQEDNDPVVFVVDTNDSKILKQDNKIIITPLENTFWIRRTRLLIQYIKTNPYEDEIATASQSAVRTDM